MVSVVIAAHNEESIIGSCLTALQAQRGDTPLHVIVSANGCTDATVRVAREHGATVIDRTEAGKAAALNAAESVASSFPRIYLDADIVVPPDAVHQIVARFDASDGILVVVPRRRVATRGRPILVKAFFAINERLPAFTDGVFGRGLIALSEEGRGRFGQFPLMVADDLFLDSLFSDGERAELPGVQVIVQAPMRTRDLVRRLVRVRRGNTEMRVSEVADEMQLAVRPSDRWSWLRDVVLPAPWLAPAAIPYVLITVCAGVLARRDSATSWGHDTSTRTTEHDAWGRA